MAKMVIVLLLQPLSPPSAEALQRKVEDRNRVGNGDVACSESLATEDQWRERRRPRSQCQKLSSLLSRISVPCLIALAVQ